MQGWHLHRASRGVLPPCNSVDKLLRWLKVALRGRGSVPSPEAVNEIFWTGFTFKLREPHKMIAIHCTHGYNRTGVLRCSLVCCEAVLDCG